MNGVAPPGDARELPLLWYRMATDLPNEAFKLWALATLKSRLHFDGALWGRWVGSSATQPARMVGAYVHRLPPEATDAWHTVIAGRADMPAGRALHACLRHAPPSGALAHALALRSTHEVRHPQYLLLTRTPASGPFDSAEADWFESVALHLMQAYSTSTRTLLHDSVVSARPIAAGAAIVERDGRVLEQDAGFPALLQREWSDWRGQPLPPQVMAVAQRRADERWIFLGRQIAATFTPVQKLLLVTVRPRSADDLLTPRESEIARQYADGAEFRQIATALHLAPATVRAHLRKVFVKMRVHNKAQLGARLGFHG